MCVQWPSNDSMYCSTMYRCSFRYDLANSNLCCLNDFATSTSSAILISHMVYGGVMIYSIDASGTVQYCSSYTLVRSSIIGWSVEVVCCFSGWTFTVVCCFTAGSFSVVCCFTVAKGQGNTVGLIVFVYSDQISTIIPNKIR